MGTTASYSTPLQTSHNTFNMSTTLAHADAHMGDGDQHAHPTKADEHTGDRQNEGVKNSHKANDPKDTRSVNNRAEAEQKEESEQEREDRMAREAPTSVAKSPPRAPRLTSRSCSRSRPSSSARARRKRLDSL